MCWYLMVFWHFDSVWAVCLFFSFVTLWLMRKSFCLYHISHCPELLKNDFPLSLRVIVIAFVTTGNMIFSLTFQAGKWMLFEITCSVLRSLFTTHWLQYQNMLFLSFTVPFFCLSRCTSCILSNHPRHLWLSASSAWAHVPTFRAMIHFNLIH